MLEIRTANGYLDIGNVSISFVLKSPIFSENDGSYAYNCTLPASDNNRKLFGFPHRIEARTTVAEINAELYFNGVLLLQGIIIVKEATTEEYEVSFGVGKGEFNYLVKDKYMNDDNMIDPTNPNDIYYFNTKAYYTSCVNKKYPETKLACFPVKNENFIESQESIHRSWLNYMNYWRNDPGFPQGFALDLTPFPYLNGFLDNLVKYCGYTLSYNSFFADSELNTLVIFNLGSKTSIKKTPTGSEISIYMEGNFSEHLPKVSISEFLKGLTVIFGAYFFINPLNKTVSIKLIKDILSDNDIVEFSRDCTSSHKCSLLSDNISFKNNYVFDEKDAFLTEKIKSIHELNLMPPVNTILYLPTEANVNDVRHVILEHAYYVYVYDEATDVFQWEYYCDEFLPDYYYGSASNPTTNETAVNTLLMATTFDDNFYQHGQAWLVPKCDMPGVFRDVFKSFDNTCSSARLLFYRGMQEDSNGNTYPLGSNDVYDYSWTKIPDANYSLKWDGEYGLIENFLKEYLFWISIRKSVKLNKQFTPIELRNLDFSKKHRINDQNYLLKEVRVTITNTEIKVAEIDGYTV